MYLSRRTGDAIAHRPSQEASVLLVRFSPPLLPSLTLIVSTFELSYPQSGLLPLLASLTFRSPLLPKAHSAVGQSLCFYSALPGSLELNNHQYSLIKLYPETYRSQLSKCKQKSAPFWGRFLSSRC